MATKRAKPTFRVSYLVRYIVSREVEASDLPDAIVKGQEGANLRLFLTDDECADDGDVEVIGVSDDAGWSKVNG